MSDKLEKKYLPDRKRNPSGWIKNEVLYLFRQAQQITKPTPIKAAPFRVSPPMVVKVPPEKEASWKGDND